MRMLTVRSFPIAIRMFLRAEKRWYFMHLDLATIMIRLLVVATCLPVHEWAHAYSAYKLGDKTAYYQGRMTINPLAHLDPFGTIMLVLVGIGWAKPVPVNANNFKNSRVGMAITAIAGPLANLLLATLFLIVFKLLYIFPGVITSFNPTIYDPVMTLFQTMMSINLMLAVFNLLPIPPLDGSRILGLILPKKAAYWFYAYQQYIVMVLMAAVFFGLLDVPIQFLARALFNVINFLTGFIR